MLNTICIYIIPVFVLANFILNWLPIGSFFIRALLYLIISLNYVLRITIFTPILKQLKKTEETTLGRGAIVSDHGNYIEEVMDVIRREKFEYLAYFNFNGKKIAEGTLLSPDESCLTIEDWHKVYSQGAEAIEVHNHPGIFDVAFSDQDFALFLSRDFCRKAVVVTKRYNYILEKTSYDYEISQAEAETYVHKMDIRYVWLSFFSVRLWSVVVAHKTAKHFNLKFSIERVRRISATKRLTQRLRL